MAWSGAIARGRSLAAVLLGVASIALSVPVSGQAPASGESDLAARTMGQLPARLDPGARVYVESAARLELSAPWRALREDRAGAVRYALYELLP